MDNEDLLLPREGGKQRNDMTRKEIEKRYLNNVKKFSLPHGSVTLGMNLGRMWWWKVLCDRNEKLDK